MLNESLLAEIQFCFQSPSQWKKSSLYSSYVAIYVFNLFLCYIAIMLNSANIHAIRKTSSLPKTLKTLLLSLAISDLGVGLLVQPLFVARIIMELQQNTENNPFYVAALTANTVTTALFSFASFLGVIALSADRFLAIHFFLSYKELVTHKRVAAVVLSIWLFSDWLLCGRQRIFFWHFSLFTSLALWLQHF